MAPVAADLLKTGAWRTRCRVANLARPIEPQAKRTMCMHHISHHHLAQPLGDRLRTARSRRRHPSAGQPARQAIASAREATAAGVSGD